MVCSKTYIMSLTIMKYDKISTKKSQNSMSDKTPSSKISYLSKKSLNGVTEKMGNSNSKWKKQCYFSSKHVWDVMYETTYLTKHVTKLRPRQYYFRSFNLIL